jgi:mono/diheme cytochrome c family protein
MQEAAVAAVVGAVAIGGVYMVYDEYSAGGAIQAAQKQTSLVHVVTKPSNMSSTAQLGENVYNYRCRSCHGPLGLGAVGGPPLATGEFAESIYPDTQMAQAILSGAPQKNYDYGRMPAQPDISDQDLRATIAFLREIQTLHGYE